MKKIFIDTNMRTQNNTILISKYIADNMELQVGERVIAYQDADSWEAEIVCENGEWGVVLLSEAKEISKERREGQEDGCWQGYYVQSMRMLTALKELNFPEKDVEAIKGKLGLVERKYPCPCCGNTTLTEQPPGTYEICPVCKWEDDESQFRDPTYKGGANRLSLEEARRQYRDL